MPLNWYSSMKKKLRKIRIIFDIENWLWKSEIGNFRSLDLGGKKIFGFKKCVQFLWKQKCTLKNYFVQLWTSNTFQFSPNFSSWLDTKPKVTDRNVSGLVIITHYPKITMYFPFCLPCVLSMAHISFFASSRLKVNSRYLL